MRLRKFHSFFFLSAIFNTALWAQPSEHALPADKILALIPDRIKGFEQLVDPKATETKIGTITYSLCEKNFSIGKKSIKILLFDYKEAPIMYAQAMRAWKNRKSIESDTLISRSLTIENGSGWESYSQSNKTSQIFLGIYDRYFLTMTGDNVDLDILKKVLLQIPLEKFPK